MVVKARKQGNSTMITIPKSFNIASGQEFDVTMTGSGELIFTPIQDASVKFATDDQLSKISEAIFDEYDDIFKELVDR